MTRGRYLLLAVTSAAISCLVFLGLAEIALRFLPDATGMRSVAVTAANPIFHFEPNRDFTYSRGWDFVMVNHGHVNNAGYVNDQDYRRDDKSPLLAIVGDSMIEALMVPFGDTIEGRLAKALAGKSRVYSFAASGAPLSQYLIWARQAVREYNANALLISVVGNDFDESHASYKTGAGFWTYTPTLDGRLELKLYELNRGLAWSMVQRSALARYLFINMHFNRYMADFSWMRALVMGKQALDQPRYAGNTEAAATDSRIKDSLNALDAFFRDLTEMTGLPPERIAFTLDGFRYPEVARQNSGTFFDRMRQAFLEKAQARGYEVIDMDRVFFPNFDQNKQRFEFERDGHWNGMAHGLAAEAVLKSSFMERVAGSKSMALTR
jgi:hypothetical protein